MCSWLLPKTYPNTVRSCSGYLYIIDWKTPFFLDRLEFQFYEFIYSIASSLSVCLHPPKIIRTLCAPSFQVRLNPYSKIVPKVSDQIGCLMTKWICRQRRIFILEKMDHFIGGMKTWNMWDNLVLLSTSVNMSGSVKNVVHVRMCRPSAALTTAGFQRTAKRTGMVSTSELLC